ncbi:MAG: hypothetical protein ACREQH_03400 [Candidatus Binatus sp.]
MRTRLLLFCILACGLASLATQSARAQSSLEVPGPPNQNQAYAPPRPTPVPFIRLAPSDGDSGNTIQLLPGWNQSPAQPQAAATPPSPPPTHLNVAPMTAQAVPSLPAVFRGCWQGEVNQLDWIRREPGAPKIGYWTPKTYKLCYKRIGDQPFSLTFTNTGIETSDKITNARGKVEPLSTDGRAYASMRSNLKFDEYKVRGNFGNSPTFAVNEVTNLDCRIAGDDMIVSADVYGTRDGDPWFRAHWRADFRRFEN